MNQFCQISYNAPVFVGCGADSGQKKSEISDFAPKGIFLEQSNAQKEKRANSEFEQAGEQKRQKLDPEVQPTSGQKRKEACSEFEEAGEEKRVRLDLQEHTKELEEMPIGAKSFCGQKRKTEMEHFGSQKKTRLEEELSQELSLETKKEQLKEQETCLKRWQTALYILQDEIDVEKEKVSNQQEQLARKEEQFRKLVEK